MFRRSATPPPGWLPLAGITLLAPALGGATQLWAQGLLLLAVAVVFIWSPPRVSPGRYWNLIFLALGALALADFLPAAWFGLPDWRRTLLEKYAVPLPGTLSAQPWLSAQGCCLYLGGLAWAYFLLAHRWTIQERQKAVRFYGLGVAALAGLCLAAYLARFKVPFWPAVGNSPIDFGFFPNRNQTANVLALAAIMMTAVAYKSSERRGPRGLLWLFPILLTCVALVVDYSRAGIVMFLGGAAAWMACAIPAARSKRIGILCLAGLALLLAGFLLYGGETLQRFEPDTGENGGQWTDYRLGVQQDALALTAQAPLLGQGLGNFEYIFPLYRDKSAAQNRALHPESDWLWVAAEMGWPAALLFLAAIAYWASQCFPFNRKTDRRLRSAAAVCGAVFALHGLVDVSGHRAGAAWPALFLFSIALHPDRRLDRKAWTAPLFRCLGILLVIVAVWWLVSSRWTGFDGIAPTSRTLEILKDRLGAATAAADYAGVVATTTEALRIAPLDWRLYFQRAVANAVSRNSIAQAKRDFALARYLEPHWAKSCFLEGEVWLALGQAGPGLDAWKEALRRAGKEDAASFYRQMVADRPLREPVRAALAEMARRNREYLLVFLDFASPLECELLIGDLLAQDPALLSLSAPQKKRLFNTWFARGDRSLLISNLLAYPDWMAEGWFWAAQDYADKKEYREAYELAMRHTPAPPMPTVTSAAPIAKLETNFFYRPDDLHAGIDLYFAQRELGRNKEALSTLLQLAKIPGCPSYILFLEAQLYGEQKDWENAWNARLEYRPLNAD